MAYAEGAWVLWHEISPPTLESSSWPVSEWHTRETCEQALTHKLASDSSADTSVDVAIDRQPGRPRLEVQRKGYPDLTTVYTYVCLPDPVDPRGAKGK
jgi:hypothetical protein